jgi:hypothetical protein
LGGTHSLSAKERQQGRLSHRGSHALSGNVVSLHLMITLKNNTKSLAHIGYVVSLDQIDPFSFVYTTPNATKAIGIVLEAVAYRQPCKIATLGDKARVFVSANVNKGDIIRLSKLNDRVSLGACAIAKSGDAPYLTIGEALESGRGLISLVINFGYAVTDDDTINVNDITFPTRIVIATTTELGSDYTIICNRATDMTVNLLAATGSCRVRQIANIGLGLVTVDCTGTDTIDDETTQPVAQWETLEIKDYISGKFKIV